MGGLITRQTMNLLNNNELKYIDNFISISSPFNGDENANYGVEYSPIKIKVWNDIASNSYFLNNLYEKTLFENIKYTLIFGYEGNNSDGVVSIESQLRKESQKESIKIRGFNENHMSILNDNEVFKFINQII